MFKLNQLNSYRQFSNSAEQVATALKALIKTELASFRQLQLILMLLCILLAGGLIALFYRYERQRTEHLQQIYQANQQLDRLSLTDGLTGIPNRRFFDQRLAKEWQRAQREHSPLTLLMLDIDYFKPYNDHYGHLRGDHCLQQIANAIDQFCQRPADVRARYGGEEFALILPNTEGAAQQAERIRAAIAALAIPHASSPIADHVTASIGYCTLVPRSEQHPDILIGGADSALYRAKAAGRNRAECCHL